MFFVVFISPPLDIPASPSGSDRKPRRFRLRSSRSNSKEESAVERETPYSPKHCPVVKQEAPSVFKEQFVPPDLSIWDYLITKVILRVFIVHVQFSSVSMQLCQNYILGISLCDVFPFVFTFVPFSLRSLRQKTELIMTQRTARTVRMKTMTMTNLKTRLRPTCHRKSIRITTRTGNGRMFGAGDGFIFAVSHRLSLLKVTVSVFT